MGGKPVIRGMRVPVELILRKLGAGIAPKKSSPITRSSRLMTFERLGVFAADYLAHEEIVYR